MEKENGVRHKVCNNVYVKKSRCWFLEQLIFIMDIIIDTKGEADLLTKDHLTDSDEDDLDFENSGD